jgi:FkbM family methyltransferase
MDFRNQVKNLLRMCGHAFVSTVHDRLNGIEGMLREILAQNTHIASTQTALLQSGVHLVEKLARVHAEIAESESRDSTHVREHTASREELQGLAAAVAEMRESRAGRADVQALAESLHSVNAGIEKVLETGAATVRSGIERMLDLSDAIRRSTAASLAVLEPVAYQTSDFLANQSVRQVCVETSDYFFTNPELGLLSFLYSYLPSRTVLDVGAHVGDVSEHLLNTGYEVYAFEPYPESYRRLTGRLGGHPEFHAFNLALGNITGELPLYTVRDSSPEKRYEDATVFYSLAPHGMPADLSFESPVPVATRKLSELQQEGLIPANVSLLKIDTEGYDLEVIRGMEGQRYPIVMVEFWDASIPFATQGLRYTVNSMVREMRQRGYMWYIVIYRVWGQNETAFYCNHDRSVPQSWGNVVFFQDREIFAEAQQWCSAVLPRTYFKHVAASPENLEKEAAGAVKA